MDIFASIFIVSVTAILLFLVGWIIFELTTVREYDPDSNPEETASMHVAGLIFVPYRTSTGIGPSIGGSGGVAVTTSTSPEEDIVILKSNGRGKKTTLKVNNIELFQNMDNDDKVKVYYHQTWRRIRLTQFKFSYQVEPCQVECEGEIYNILGCVED